MDKQNGLPAVNDKWHFPPNSVRCTGASVVYTWPRWLRWLERRWRAWKGVWHLSYSFECLPPHVPERVMYTYSFNVWPDETRKFNRHVYNLFRIMNNRVELNFTEKEFDDFRAHLDFFGLTLRAVCRAPYIEPEAVL